MKTTLRYLSAIFSVLYLMSGISAAQESGKEKKRDFNLELSTDFGHVIGLPQFFNGNHNYVNADLIGTWRIKPGYDDIYAQRYNYPMAGIGFAYESFSLIDMDRNSRMGDVWSVFADWKRDMVRTRLLNFGYMVQAGFAYSSHRYDPITNPRNEFFSFPLNFHLAAGLYLGVDLGHNWNLSANLRLKHHSNGRLMIPNQGVNMVEAGIGANYTFGADEYVSAEPSVTDSLSRADVSGLYRKWNFHVTMSGGFQSTRAEWKAYNSHVEDPQKKQKDFKLYPRLGLSFDAMYRYSLKCSTGLAAEFYWYGGLDELKKADTVLNGEEKVAQGPGYKPFVFGLALVHEFHYKSVSLALALGVYPYKKLGICTPTTWNYQKAGIRWYIPKAAGLFLGYAVKAHGFQESEYMEMSLGFKF